MMEVFWSIIGFVLMMGVIVTIHEYGHFQVAKWFNVKVTDFSIGFGKPLYQKQFGETSFKVAMIPLGGFVKFVDEREGSVAPEDLSRAFNRQSVYKRFAVVLAGPMINLVLAWWVFSSMQLIGMNTLKPLIDTQTLQEIHSGVGYQSHHDFAEGLLWEVTEMNGKRVHSWQEVHQQVLQSLIHDRTSIDIALSELSGSQSVQLNGISLNGIDINNPDENWLKKLGFEPASLEILPVVGEIVPAGPGELAGLQKGDQVIRFNQQEISSWQQFVQQVQTHPDELIQLQILRNGQTLVKQVQLSSVEDNTNPEILVGRIGVGVLVDEQQMQPYMNFVRYGLVEAFTLGYERSVELLQMSLQMLKKMILGEVSLSHLSGPLSIAQFSGQAVQSGLISFLSLLGLLSLSIGFLNLLPIPVLDGGHLLYYLVEMIKGSPVSEKVMLVGQNIGLFIIIGLTLLALFNDVIRISNG